MFSRWIIAFLFFGICSSLSFSQETEAPAATVANLDQEERAYQIKDQAISILKSNVLTSNKISNLRQRTDLMTESFILLWDYDQRFAAESLIAFIEQSLSNYTGLLTKDNRTFEEGVKLRDLDYALRNSLMYLAKREIENAKLLREQYFKIKEDNLKAKNINEEFQLAAEGMDIDELRTLELLSAIIQYRIPSQFPKLISDIRKKNPLIAEILLQRAIQNLSVNPNYKATDAILISVVVFNESVIVVPLLPDNSNPNEFGVYTTVLGNQSHRRSEENIVNFLFALQRFFNLRLHNQQGGEFSSPQSLLQSYFLLEKSRLYGQAYGLIDSSIFDSSQLPILALMHASGFSSQTFAALRGYAHGLVFSENPLGLSDGADLLEKAENAKTPEEKLDYLIRGIIQLIEFKKYTEAESRIFDVQDIEIRDALYLLLNQRSGAEAIKEKRWREFERRTERIRDRRIKAFMYLSAASEIEQGDEGFLSAAYYLNEAEKSIQHIADRTIRASALVHLTFLALSRDQTAGRLGWPNTLKSINEAPEYNEHSFEIVIEIPTRNTHYAEFIGSGSFRNLFTRLAELDWNDSQSNALQLKNDGLKAIAQLAAAKAVLEKTSFPK